MGPEKTWCGGVDCATGAGDVCKCAEPWPCWWRVWSEGWCSPRISTQPAALHHCAWSLITRVPLWGSLGGPLCRWPCYHRWIAWGMCQEALDLERSNGEERTESKCRKDKGHDLRYGTGPPAEFRRVSMRRLSHWSQQQQHLLQWLQALGAQEMQWAQALEKWPWLLQMYTVLGNCTLLGWQTTEGSPGRTWQAWGGSFLLLPRRHALSSRWLWTLNHNMCENSLEEVQGSNTSSLFTHPLFQNTWPCVQLLCAERNAPCQRDLAIDKAEPSASAGKWQGNDQTDLQFQAARHCHHQVQWATFVAWHWGSGPHSEGEKIPMVWTCGTLQWCSQDSLWHTGWWKAWACEAQNDMEAPDREGLQSGSSRLSTLMIDVPGDLVWDLLCVQQASYLEGGPLMWMLPLYLHINKKSDYIYIYPFSMEVTIPTLNIGTPVLLSIIVLNFWQAYFTMYRLL